MWLDLNREGTPVARNTVERLMRALCLQGAKRGKRFRTTVPDPGAARPGDLAKRNFNPLAPILTWVADFTYCPTWSGMVYVVFVIDAYSRRILGWRAATHMKSSLVLDALEQGDLDPCPRRCQRPCRAGPPQRRRVPAHLNRVHRQAHRRLS